jgi:hypothetical protein
MIYTLTWSNAALNALADIYNRAITDKPPLPPRLTGSTRNFGATPL